MASTTLCRAEYGVRGKDGVDANLRATDVQLIPGHVALAVIWGCLAYKAAFLAVTVMEEPDFVPTVEQSFLSSGRNRCLLASGHCIQAFLTAVTRTEAVVATLRSWEALLGICRTLMMMRTAPATWEAEASGADGGPLRRERMSSVLVRGACSKNCAHVGREPPGVVAAGAWRGAC